MKLIITEHQLKKIIPIMETSGELDKHYIKTGVFDDEDRNVIMNITGGDNFTKLISDMYKYLANKYNPEMVTPRRINDGEVNYLKRAHERLKTYNQNVFPLKDVYAKDEYTHPLGIANDLDTRERIIGTLKTFPKLWLRNLKPDIRKERDEYEFKKLWETIGQIERSLNLIKQVKEEQQEKIIKKVFSSKFTTFEDISKRLSDTTIPYLSEESTIDEMVSKVEDMDHEAEIVYNKDNILVVVIKSPEAMQYLGCSSQWCFAIGTGNWDEYSPEGYATIVYNFNEESSENTRMVVVLDHGAVYDMYNEYMEDGDSYLIHLGVFDVIPVGEIN